MPAFPPLPQAINPLVQVQTWQPTQPWIDYFNGLDGIVRPISGGGSAGGVTRAPFDALAYNGMQINGSMEVSQENGSSAVVLVSGTSKYIVDGWTLNTVGTQVLTGQQSNTPPVGFKNMLVVLVGTANASPAAGHIVYIQHNIEGYRTARLAFGTASASAISIGFWVISVNRTGTLSGSVRNNALNRSYAFTVTINATGTWEYKTVTIPGDTTGTWTTDNGTGLSVFFTLMSGGTFTTAPGVWTAGNFVGATGTTNFVASVADIVAITGVVVLPGIETPAAARSPFIMRPFTEELEICRRYYQKSYDYGVNPGTAVAGAGEIIEFIQGLSGATTTLYRSVSLSPRMRSAPTAITYSSNSGVANAIFDGNASVDRGTTYTAAGNSGFAWTSSVAIAGTQINVQYHWTADARL